MSVLTENCAVLTAHLCTLHSYTSQIAMLYWITNLDFCNSCVEWSEDGIQM